MRKVSQQKILSGQWKTLSSQRKIWFGFQKSIFPFGRVFFQKMVSRKSLSKLSCVCLSLEKLVNEKHFPVKAKFSLFFKKVFPGKFGRKTLSRNWKKFRNIIIC